jgi:hypothetical protein
MMLHGSLRAFMAQLIDYAGLFPPASLATAPAAENYAAYRAGADGWMLGRFICPAARLEELGEHVALFADGAPLTVAAIGRRSDGATFLEGLSEDLDAIAAFRARHGAAVRVDVLEQPLPAGRLEQAVIDGLAQRATAAGLLAFCELPAPLDDGWIAAQGEALATLGIHNQAGQPPLAYKLRTGGVTADAFPSPEQVAAALAGARDAGVAMKFTAGLHHPFRQHRDEVGASMHGFVNLLAAGILAHVHTLDQPTIAAILADEEAAAFSFSAAGLAWRELTASSAAIGALRAGSLIAFGSCSFDEPRDELRALGLLPKK